MKILKNEYLINKGSFADSEDFKRVLTDITEAIKLITWPEGSKTFSIYPEKHGNGVTPIKLECMKHLAKKGWIPEERLLLGSRLKPGPVDAVLTIPHIGKIAFEWETGNVSSSHRALNKMVLGMMNKVLVAGFLAVPSKDLYPFLTDRIGSFAEIEPYFPVWRSSLVEGVLCVIEIEHDSLSTTVPKIPKGTDGRALV